MSLSALDLRRIRLPWVSSSRELNNWVDLAAANLFAAEIARGREYKNAGDDVCKAFVTKRPKINEDTMASVRRLFLAPPIQDLEAFGQVLIWIDGRRGVKTFRLPE